MLQEQDNEWFSLKINAEKQCYDLILKKDNYETSAVMLNLVSFIHQIGVRHPEVNLRIGAMFEEDKPKIIQ